MGGINVELTIAFVRAGACKAELAGRLSGMSDEPLAQKSRQQILSRKDQSVYPDAPIIFCGYSPRCVETARLIWPSPPIIVERDLRPISYGAFEGKDSRRLTDDGRFLRWASAKSAEAFPGGESPMAMQARSVQAFGSVTAEMASKGIACAAVVSHLLVIQAIFQRFCVPRPNFCNWEIAYGGCVMGTYDTMRATLEIKEKNK